MPKEKKLTNFGALIVGDIFTPSDKGVDLVLMKAEELSSTCKPYKGHPDANHAVGKPLNNAIILEGAYALAVFGVAAPGQHCWFHPDEKVCFHPKAKLQVGKTKVK